MCLENKHYQIDVKRMVQSAIECIVDELVIFVNYVTDCVVFVTNIHMCLYIEVEMLNKLLHNT